MDPVNSSAITKQLVALVVGHELAHQWFGNLVSSCVCSPYTIVVMWRLLIAQTNLYVFVCLNFLCCNFHCHVTVR